jgi:hypothetical protein
MEHQNCCADLWHPELLAACCPYSSVHGKLVVQHPSPPLRSFRPYEVACVPLSLLCRPTRKESPSWCAFTTVAE